MKYALSFLLLLLLLSCNYFDVKKTSPEAILQEELKTFNWEEVDTYPSFSACDSNISKLTQKRCFERILRDQIIQGFQNETIIVTQDVRDTITLEFQVSEKGQLTLKELKVDSVTLKEIPNLKMLISKSLDSLPQIFPAIKRNQQVKTAFVLPLIIDVN